MVLVQKLQDNCSESLNLGHTDTVILKNKNPTLMRKR